MDSEGLSLHKGSLVYAFESNPLGVRPKCYTVKLRAQGNPF